MSVFKKIHCCFLILVSLLFTYSCNDGETTVQSRKSKTKNEQIQLDLGLETFTYVPPQIKGCSCYLSRNKEEFDQKIYIYVNDFVVTSYVNINGVLTKFIMLNFDYVNSKNSVANYKSFGYEMKVEVFHHDKNKKEEGIKTGKITIKTKDGRTTTKSFYGKCHC